MHFGDAGGGLRNLRRTLRITMHCGKHSECLAFDRLNEISVWSMDDIDMLKKGRSTHIIRLESSRPAHREQLGCRACSSVRPCSPNLSLGVFSPDEPAPEQDPRILASSSGMPQRQIMCTDTASLTLQAFVLSSSSLSLFQLDIGNHLPALQITRLQSKVASRV